MREYKNLKEIIYLRVVPDYIAKCGFKICSSTYVCPNDYGCFHWGEHNIKQELLDRISPTLVGDILYFIKGTTFTKNALTGSKLKRKLHIQSASDVVVSDKVISNVLCFKNVHLFETDDYFYAFDLRSNASFDPKWYLKKEYAVRDCKDLGLLSLYNSKNADILKLMFDYKDKNVVRPLTVETALKNSSSVLTEADVDSIRSMLKSSDHDTIELGIKLLHGHNYLKTPSLTKFMLLENDEAMKILTSNTSIIYKTMVETLKLSRSLSGSDLTWTRSVNYKNASEDEKALIQSFLKKVYIEYYEKQMELAKLRYPEFPNISLNY